MATLTEKLSHFNFVTVMDVKVYESNNGARGTDLGITLDSLRVANITQEGPTKTAKGGLYANTLARYGKTMRLEMEDVIGRIEALKYFMGVQESSASTESGFAETAIASTTAGQVIELTHTPSANLVITADPTATTLVLNTDYFVNGKYVTIVGVETNVEITYDYEVYGKYSITDKFSSAKYLEGTTFVIDESGNKQWIKIVIPSFLPDSTFNLNMESEGNFGVININGKVKANACGEFMYLADDATEHTCG